MVLFRKQCKIFSLLRRGLAGRAREAQQAVRLLGRQAVVDISRLAVYGKVTGSVPRYTV